MARSGPARFALVLAACAWTLAWAKLPAPSEEAKAKAAEATAKAAWSNKVSDYQLCKSQDAVASAYYAAAKKAGRDLKPPVATPLCVDPGPFVYNPPVAAAPAPAVAAAPPAAAAKP